MVPKIDNKLKQKLISRIRREWYWSDLRKNALSAAKYNNSYQCQECQIFFPKNGVQVDHHDPVVDPEKGFQGFDKYISRMFCSIKNLRVLCKGCHKEKTAQDRLRRKAKTAKSSSRS